jgi:hypothetical protein
MTHENMRLDSGSINYYGGYSATGNNNLNNNKSAPSLKLPNNKSPYYFN